VARVTDDGGNRALRVDAAASAIVETVLPTLRKVRAGVAARVAVPPSDPDVFEAVRRRLAALGVSLIDAGVTDEGARWFHAVGSAGLGWKVHDAPEPAPPTALKSIRWDALEKRIDAILKPSFQRGRSPSREEVFAALVAGLNPAQALGLLETNVGKERAASMAAQVEAQLGRAAIPLLADPAVATRLEALLAYARSPGVDRTDLIKLRQGFRAECGEVTMYRAVQLDEAELKNLREAGFVAAGLRSDALEASQYPSYAVFDLAQKLEVHDGYSMTGSSTVISSSNYPEVAMYGATIAARDRGDGSRWYLLPLTLPEFDVIRYGWHLPKVAPMRLGEMSFGSLRLMACDPGIEGFSQFSIPPSAIDFDRMTEFRREDVPEMVWRQDPRLDERSNLDDATLSRIDLSERFKERPSEVPGFGVLGIIPVPDLERATGRRAWLGRSDQHPASADWKSWAKRQPLFVDERLFFDLRGTTEALKASLER
jgi:hypothetical protein